MGTVVTIQVAGHGSSSSERGEREEAVARAVGWFRRIEEACTRFEAGSELRRLSAQIGSPVPVSSLLYEAVQFALRVAEESGGAFDPTVGQAMQARGFDREFRTGQAVPAPANPSGPVSYRDVHLDPEQRTITLDRPMVLDLGAVAKGLAIDLAARELQPCHNFLINAGGDLYLGGRNAGDQPWSVGVRHPRDEQKLIETLHVSDAAVCTSGDYERRLPGSNRDHHIMDPRSGTSALTLASVTVIAPSAMVADVLATAAFVLGPREGLAFLDGHGVDGLLITPTLERHLTSGMRQRVETHRAAPRSHQRNPRRPQPGAGRSHPR
jgi:thiamine biosynthesis lipoprotein